MACASNAELERALARGESGTDGPDRHRARRDSGPAAAVAVGVTRRGQRPDQPIPFSHKHHVQGAGAAMPVLPHLGGGVELRGDSADQDLHQPCHSQIRTNAALLRPVRDSLATRQSIQWIKVHDLPDFVYFNHSIHVNKGIGCASCHGRVDEMPLMCMQNSLQMGGA